MLERDFVGYANELPQVEWPGGASLAISLAVNFEEGAERSILDGDPESDPQGETPARTPPGVRNTLNESYFEYGSRVGIWRLLDLFDKYDVPVTFFACGQAMERNPKAAAEITRRGHEACSHGYRWVDNFSLSREEQREDMLRSIEAIRTTTGERPLGYYPRGASVDTQALAAEEGGFIYDSSTNNEDMPHFVQAGGKKLLTIPYSLDCNDFRYWRNIVGPDQFFNYLKATFDQLYEEAQRTPKMMSVGLHCRCSGLPARTRAVEQFIAYARSFPGVWFARRVDIARWWWEKFG